MFYLEAAKTHFIILKHLGMRTGGGAGEVSYGLQEEPYAHVCIPKVSEGLSISGFHKTTSDYIKLQSFKSS